MELSGLCVGTNNLWRIGEELRWKNNYVGRIAFDLEFPWPKQNITKWTPRILAEQCLINDVLFWPSPSCFQHHPLIIYTWWHGAAALLTHHLRFKANRFVNTKSQALRVQYMKWTSNGVNMNTTWCRRSHAHRFRIIPFCSHSTFDTKLQVFAMPNHFNLDAIVRCTIFCCPFQLFKCVRWLCVTFIFYLRFGRV